MHLPRSIHVPLILITLTLFISCGPKKQKSVDTKQDTAVKPQSNVVVPGFNADTAYAFIAKQVSFGPRIPGTPAQEKCAQWLYEKLKSYTPDVVLQDIQVDLYNGKKVPCKNLVASFNPEVKKRVLLCAHWDTRPWSDQDSIDKKKSFEGADDGGSGVGVLLEIARLLKTQKPDVGIDIAFFDVEDYGPATWENINEEELNAYCLGTQEWASRPHMADYRGYYGILLDMVGAKNATFPQEGMSLEYAPSIVKKVWDTANSLGFGNYFTYQRVKGIIDDHVYVNRINQTPCIDIINMDKTSPTGFARHWHTQRDNMSIIDKNTLNAVGQTLLQVIFSETSGVGGV
jgi:hypothetical protein